MSGYGDIRDTLLELPHHPWPDPASGAHYVTSNIFPVKWELLRSRCPDARSVFEFGALVGYFLVTALDACPQIEQVGWVDNEVDLPGSNSMVCGNLGSTDRKWIRETRRLRWFDRPFKVMAHVVAGTHYDIVHVDGAHSYPACITDLTLALAMRPRLILVDDYQAIAPVRQATDDWAAYVGLGVEEVGTVNGLAVIEP